MLLSYSYILLFVCFLALGNVDVYALRIPVQHQQGDRAYPRIRHFDVAPVPFDHGSMAVRGIVVVRGSVAFLEALHGDVRHPGLQEIAAGRHVDDGLLRVPFLLRDVLAETVCPRHHHKVVVRERVTWEIDVPGAVRLKVECKVKCPHRNNVVNVLVNARMC